MLSFIYFLIIIFAAIAAPSNGVLFFISGILGPLLAWFAGAGTRGMFFHGRYIAGLLMGLVTAGIGFGLVYYTQYSWFIADYHLEGWVFLLIGLIIGFVSATAEHAEAPTRSI